MNGCVAAISVDIGKVLDIEVMSSYFPTCKRLQTMPRKFEYESSKADHICQCNFTGSSSKMEIVGAFRIFLRSEKNSRLQYTQHYRDSDSKAFMSVKDTYGLNSVTKFECIGPVQKRVAWGERWLSRIVRSPRSQTLAEITTLLNDGASRTVSKRIMQLSLQRMGFGKHRTTKLLLLNARHRAAHLSWARDYKDWSVEDME
ncbi:uncharacterized protein TNCV_4256431 [Trichonephila clavipes]|nr:uncharacterized protein TNCV_4256431 [Trichonephila clavipes]